MDIKELSQLSGPPEDHWYYASKFDLLASAVKSMGARRIADVGAGSGVFARLLLLRTDCEEALCVDPSYEREHDELVNGKLLRFRRSYEEGAFDLVLLMDVLEHVDDDVGLLAQVSSALKPGTPLFITVPAFQVLWSAHDEFLDHRRRYRAGGLTQAVRAAGLQVEWTRYFFASILPVAALARALTRFRAPSAGSDLRPTPPLLDRLLRAVLKAERRFLFRSNRIAGLSVVSVARLPLTPA